MRQEPETEILRKEGEVVGFPGFFRLFGEKIPHISFGRFFRRRFSVHYTKTILPTNPRLVKHKSQRRGELPVAAIEKK